MKRLNRLIRALVAVTVIFSGSCGKQEKTTEGKAGTAGMEEPVKVIELKYRNIARSVEYPSTLKAFEEVHLAPSSPGRIESIFFQVGDRVKEGDILVHMDRTPLHQAEVQLKNLEIDFKRLDTLQKTGSIARQPYDQLKAQYEIAQSNVEFLTENIRLEAPFSGVISGRYYEPGELYSAAPSAGVGKAAILSIVQIDRLKALVALSEQYFPLIKNGMEATVLCDIYPGKEFSGAVFRIHPTIEPQNRTFNVEISVKNPEGLLRPGMFSRVKLDLDEERGILLPSHAILKMQGSNERYLFTAEEGKAHRVSVRTGKRYDDLIEVISDELQPGQQVIATGQARLVDGSAIRITQD